MLLTSWSNPKKMKTKSFKISAVMAIVALIALLLSFAKVADAIANLIHGKDSAKAVSLSSKIQNTARTILVVAVGAFLITSGIAALAVPVVGIALLVVGVALMAYALWPMFSKQSAG